MIEKFCQILSHSLLLQDTGGSCEKFFLKVFWLSLISNIKVQAIEGQSFYFPRLKQSEHFKNVDLQLSSEGVNIKIRWRSRWRLLQNVDKISKKKIFFVYKIIFCLLFILFTNNASTFCCCTYLNSSGSVYRMFAIHSRCMRASFKLQ